MIPDYKLVEEFTKRSPGIGRNGNMARKTVWQRLAAWESTPVVNAMSTLDKPDADRLYKLLIRMHMPKVRPTLSSVKRVQRQHGPQDYCWVGPSQRRRYYVWEFGDRARVFVHNVGGISFEVNEALPPIERLHELRKFVARMEGVMK